MTNQNLSESKKLKGGSLVASKTTISGAVLRVALALALVLGLMPSLGNSVAFANESNEDANAALAGYPESQDLKVTFDFDGGTTTAQSVQTIEFDGSEYYVSSPNPLPTKAGFELTGWEIQSPDNEEMLDASFEDEAFFDRDSNGDCAVTLKAQWKEVAKSDPVSGPYSLMATVVDTEGNPVSGVTFGLYRTGDAKGSSTPGAAIYGSNLKSYSTDSEGVLSIEAADSYAQTGYFLSTVKYAALKSADKNYKVSSISLSNESRSVSKDGDSLLYLGYSEKLTNPRIDYFYRFAFDDIDYINLDSSSSTTSEPVQIDSTVKIVVEKRTGVYKDDLESAISKAESLKESDYFSGWYALTTALNSAKGIDADAAATQDAVDAAEKALSDAIGALVEYPGSTDSKIQVLVLGTDGQPYAGDLKFAAYQLGDDGNPTDTILADDLSVVDGVVALSYSDLTSEKNCVLRVKDGQSLSSDDTFTLKVSAGSQWFSGYFVSVNGEDLPYSGSLKGLKCQLKDPISWTADDFTYDETDKSTITGLSDSGKAKIVKNTEVVIPATKTDGTAITAIGNDSTSDNLFKTTVDGQTYEATKVTIPEGVTSIGKMAFKAYAGESITLPSTLTTIGMAAFQGSKLTSIVIPDSVTTVANGVFSNSTGLTTAKLGKGMTSVPGAMFSGCAVKNVSIPEGITSIGRLAFSGCHTETLTFEGTPTCTEIAQEAFLNNQFETLDIPASVKTVGKLAFRVIQSDLDKKLKSLTLNEGLETISQQSFDGTSLTEVNLPSTVTSLDTRSFMNNAGEGGTVTLWVTDGAQLADHGNFHADGTYNGTTYHKTQLAEQGQSVKFVVTGQDKDGKAEPWIEETEFKMAEGSKASDLSEKAFNARGITFSSSTYGADWYLNSITSPFDSTNTLGTEKVGIRYAYWHFLINGEMANVSAGGYTLQDGDVISWVYSLDAPFIDVDENTDHNDSIVWMSDQGITTGWLTDEGYEFRPYQNIARCDMAAFIYRMAGSPEGEIDESVKTKFSDVTEDTPHCDAIWWMASKGITTGFSDGTFRPLDNIARCDMAAFLYRFAGQPTDFDHTVVDSLVDVSFDTYHYEAIAWLAAEGITKGFPDGTFRPLDNIVRCDMAAFVQRTHEVVNS